MTEPTPLSWDALIDRVPQLPVNPAITHDRGRSYRLERTRQLLEAVALTADAEMRERGLDPNVTPNPINRLLFRQVEHGLFDKIATAIERSANGNRFGNTTTPRNTRWVRDARVRLVRRPDDWEDIDMTVDVGTEGTLLNESEADDGTFGWDVNFDDGWGIYWTTTASLELI